MTFRSGRKAARSRKPILNWPVIGCCSSLGPRAKGYSVNPGLVFPDAWGIAVAALDDRGQPIRQPKLAAVLPCSQHQSRRRSFELLG